MAMFIVYVFFRTLLHSGGLPFHVLSLHVRGLLPPRWVAFVVESRYPWRTDKFTFIRYDFLPEFVFCVLIMIPIDVSYCSPLPRYSCLILLFADMTVIERIIPTAFRLHFVPRREICLDWLSLSLCTCQYALCGCNWHSVCLLSHYHRKRPDLLCACVIWMAAEFHSLTLLLVVSVNCWCILMKVHDVRYTWHGWIMGSVMLMLMLMIILVMSVQCCSIVFNAVHQCSKLFNCVQSYSKLFISVQQCSMLFISVQHYSMLFNSVQHYSTRI